MNMSTDAPSIYYKDTGDGNTGWRTDDNDEWQWQAAELRAAEIVAVLEGGRRCGDVEWVDEDDPDLDLLAPEIFSIDDHLAITGGSIMDERVEQAFVRDDQHDRARNRQILIKAGISEGHDDSTNLELSDDELAGWYAWERQQEPQTPAEAAGWLARQLIEHWKADTLGQDAPNPWWTPGPWQSEEMALPHDRCIIGPRAFAALCLATFHVPLANAAVRLIFESHAEGHFEGRFWWIVKVSNETSCVPWRHLLGGSFVTVHGALVWGDTWDGPPERSYMRVLGQGRSIEQAISCLPTEIAAVAQQSLRAYMAPEQNGC